jgi:ABC-type uncharacterized transport system involved in gliding motility auxiliary subunit
MQRKTVYFLTGHDERDFNNFDEGSTGYGYATQGLIGDNYEVKPLNLAQEGKVPEDAAVIIVAGPKKELLEGEGEMLDNYLKRGGRMLFLLDPDPPESFRKLLERWGVTVREGQVIDLGSSVAGDPKTPLLSRYQYTPFLPQLTGVLDVTFFPGLAALAPSQEELPDTIALAQLALTTRKSWLIKDPERTTPEEGDEQGPFTPAVAVRAIAPIGEEPPENPEEIKEAALVIFGDSDFATNKYFYAYMNGDFLLNAVNWLTGDVALISIRPKPFAFRELVLTRRELDFIRYSSWFLLPIAMILAGGLAWWRRR